MKKVLFILALLLVFVLSSMGCDQSSKNTQEHYEITDISIQLEGTFGDTIRDLYYRAPYLYVVGVEHTAVYDLRKEHVQLDGKAKGTIYSIGGCAVCADESFVYLLKEDGTLSKYQRETMALTEEYAFPVIGIQGEIDGGTAHMAIQNESIVIARSYLVEALESEGYQYFLFDTETTSLQDISDSIHGNDKYSNFISFSFMNDTHIALVSVANTNYLSPIFKIYEYNVKKHSVDKESVLDFWASNCVYDCVTHKYIYSPDSNHFYQYDIEEQTKIPLFAMEGAEQREVFTTGYSLRKMLASDSVLFLYSDIEQSIVVQNVAPDTDSLRIATNVRLDGGYLNMEQLIDKYRRNYGKNVIVTYYDSDEVFFDKLQMQLMSKSNDFDIYYVNGAQEGILHHVLRYDLYLPLEQNGAVAKNLGEFHDGMCALMTDDGHIWGIPVFMAAYFSLQPTDAFMDSGLDMPSAHWTYREFWNLCEALKNAEDSDGLTLMHNRSVTFNMILDMLHEQIECGIADENEIATFLEKIKYYVDYGVLFDLDAEPLLKGGPTYYSIDTKMVYPEYGLLAYPTDTSNRIQVTNVMFINVFSSRVDAAYAFIETMTREENLYSNGLGNGLYKTQIIYGKNPEKSSFYSHMNENTKAYYDVAAELFSNSKPCFIDLDSYYQFLNEEQIEEKFMNGTLSPAEAAKKLADFIRYRYIE